MRKISLFLCPEPCSVGGGGYSGHLWVRSPPSRVVPHLRQISGYAYGFNQGGYAPGKTGKVGEFHVQGI